MKRALLVIDVQNEYVTGKLPIAHPPVEETLSHIETAMDTAADAGLPVVVVQQTAPENSPIFARGSHGGALHEAVANRPRALLVEKTLPSCFPDTGLDDWLRARRVDTVVIVGYMTQNCGDSTARDAAHRGYAVEFLSDATGTVGLSNEAGSMSAAEVHRSTLVVLQSRFAAVGTTQQWADAVRGGKPLPAPDIVASTGAAGAA